jgi:hypothetical protein
MPCRETTIKFRGAVIHLLETKTLFLVHLIAYLGLVTQFGAVQTTFRAVKMQLRAAKIILAAITIK